MPLSQIIVEVFQLPFGGIGSQGSSDLWGGVNKATPTLQDWGLSLLCFFFYFSITFTLSLMFCASTPPSFSLPLIISSLLQLETLYATHYFIYLFSSLPKPLSFLFVVFIILFFVCCWGMRGKHDHMNFSTVVIKWCSYFLNSFV